MKHIKNYEGFSDGIYDIKDIYSWWAGINVTEDEDYYILNLENEYLTNSIIQLKNGLRNKVVEFYCKYHEKYEQLKIKNVEYNDRSKDKRYSGELIFTTELIPSAGIFSNNTVHVINRTKPIKISKIHIETDKYNL